jgi:hypothetical protein
MTEPCRQCGEPRLAITARFCASCGAQFVMAPSSATLSLDPHIAPSPTPATPIGAEPRNRLIGTCRFLSAACMFMAVLAIMSFGSTSATGRLLIVASVLVAMLGQLYAIQASKPAPPPWIGLPLLCFWVGLAALPIIWTVAWMQR